MTVAKSHDAYEQGETPAWAWPVHAFVAWLATIFSYIANFKRARRFKPEWRDSWEGLRQSEWLRDQLIAQGVAQLLNNEDVKLDDTKISLTPPDSFGGPCPRTPFDMNRRFLALARWAADPEAIIRERFRRLKAGGCPLRRTARATSPTLRVEEESNRASRHLSSSNAKHWGRWQSRSCATDGGGSRRLTFSGQPRGPPTIPIRYSLFSNHLSAPARLRTPPRARARITAP